MCSSEKTTTGTHRIVITGSIQSGKSSLAWSLMEELRQLSIPMAGFIAKGMWKDNQRSGFDLFDLKRQTMTPLAKRSKFENPPPSGMPYTFLREGVNAGRRALTLENCRDAKIIMVDELGKMELQGKGWAPFIPPLLELKKSIHIWIIREALVSPICRIWPFNRTDIIQSHENNALSKLVTLCTTSA